MHVPYVIDEIRQNDGVEGVRELEFVRVGDNLVQMAMPGSRAGDHSRRKIDPYPKGRLKPRQQIALSASDFKDSRSWRYQMPIYVREPALVKASPASP